MGSRLGLAKERSATDRAKSAMHATATVCHTGEVARLSYDLERRRAKASANRSTACAQVLAITAPANPCGDRRFRALPANRAAKAPARHCHGILPGKEERNAPLQIVRLPACASAIFTVSLSRQRVHLLSSAAESIVVGGAHYRQSQDRDQLLWGYR